MKFSLKDFFSKCDQIGSVLRIWSQLLTKYLMKTLFFVQCGLRVRVVFLDQVDQVQLQKHLGLFLDPKLSFDENIQCILNKTSKIIELIRKLQPSYRGQPS